MKILTYSYTPSAGGLGSWTSAKSPTSSHAFGGFSVLDDDTVLLAGGYTPSGYVSTAERYSPSTNSWVAAGIVPTPRSQSMTVKVPSGVLMLGGQFSTTAMTDVDFYNPTTNSWTSMTPMLSARHDATAVYLSTGYVYVAGGGVATAELYDLKSDRWFSTDTLTKPRTYHTSTVLLDGSVLLAGGQTTPGFDVTPPTNTVIRYRQSNIGEMCTYTAECSVGTCTGGFCTAATTDSGPTDTGIAPDSGVSGDTGSTSDSGVSSDTGSSDTGGSSTDAGVTDTGSTTSDSGTADSDSKDSAVGHDSTSDSGTSADAGDSGVNCDDADADDPNAKKCFGPAVEWPDGYFRCSCETAPSKTGAGWGLGAMALLGVVLIRRRRTV
jgi:MYXO-CTERM domain-containing protein